MSILKFEIVKRVDGKFEGRLVAPNGTAVMTTRIRSDVLAVKVDLTHLRDAAQAEVVDLSHDGG